MEKLRVKYQIAKDEKKCFNSYSKIHATNVSYSLVRIYRCFEEAEKKMETESRKNIVGDR